MLEHLHIRNVALIKESEISFGDGLNILTGETGAGKSMIICPWRQSREGFSAPRRKAGGG